jgi:hypothetical protein
MFLVKLYQFSKMLFIGFVIFILLFCVINLKQGLVVTPVFQYGMYSAVAHLSDTQSVYKIYVNNKAIDFTKFSFEENDDLLVSVSNYEKAKKSNAIIFETMKRIVGKAGIAGFMTEVTFSNNISDQVFIEWYTKRVEKIMGSSIQAIEIFSQKMLYQNDTLRPVLLPVKLFSSAVIQ